MIDRSRMKISLEERNSDAVQSWIRLLVNLLISNRMQVSSQRRTAANGISTHEHILLQRGSVSFVAIVTVSVLDCSLFSPSSSSPPPLRHCAAALRACRMLAIKLWSHNLLFFNFICQLSLTSICPAPGPLSFLRLLSSSSSSLVFSYSPCLYEIWHLECWTRQDTIFGPRKAMNFAVEFDRLVKLFSFMLTLSAHWLDYLRVLLLFGLGLGTK